MTEWITAKDVYARVLLSVPDMTTVQFFVWLADGVAELCRRYDTVLTDKRRTRVGDMEDRLPVHPWYAGALAPYICAQAAGDADGYSRYMAEFVRAADGAYHKLWRENKPGRVYAPPRFR